VWQRDLREDAKRDPPMWGFASSPLVVGNVVVVQAGGDGDRGVLAYDRETGELQWSAPSGNHSYSSPQLSSLGGSDQVLMLTNDGITLIDPNDGSITFEHAWEYEGYRAVQPQVFDGNAILLGTGVGAGTRRIDLDTSGDDWTAEERWTSLHMKPDFNDYVIHQGFLYGFDANVFACVDLATGKRKWKKGRYGSGQVLLLPDANQLLVISETGELVLLAANPESLEELARFPAIDGKTWNHPVLVGNRLFIRNGVEAACFELATIRSAAL
jgi:outer membrane protein assembly factor BamB